jgi:hypothetical protein
MATRPKFAKMVNYSRECVEASHIFLKNSPKRVLASLASPRNTARRVLASLASLRNTAWRMSASLASPGNTAWQMSASLASPTHFRKRRVSREYSNSLNSPASSHCLFFFLVVIIFCKSHSNLLNFPVPQKVFIGNLRVISISTLGNEPREKLFFFLKLSVITKPFDIKRHSDLMLFLLLNTI